METCLPWKILHFQIEEEIQDLDLFNDMNYGGIYAIFWWKNIPLGHQLIYTHELPLPRASLVNLIVQKITLTIGNLLFSQGFTPKLPGAEKLSTFSPDFQKISDLKFPLKALDKYWLEIQNKNYQETVSIVICTRDRPHDLEKCLLSILSLSQKPHEIIVVDNAPTTEKTKEIVAKIGQGIRYVVESKPGLSVARNTGIHASSGSIIVFTDDDVIVHPNWLRQILYTFEFPDVKAMTGLVLPSELETESQVIFEVDLDGFSFGYRAKIFDDQFVQLTKSKGVPVWFIGAGANMAFRREVFKQIGEFDERLGAGSSGCSEDSEMWYRILAEGGVCRYEPTAVVFHSHRRDLIGLKSQMYQYLRGHTVALFIQFERYGHWGNLVRIFWILPIHYIMVLIYGLRTGFSATRYLVYLSEVMGFLAGIQFYLFKGVFHKQKKVIS